jgi:hypothetical protein
LKNGEKKTIDELGYDNTKTAIEGGLVTSGTVQLAGDDSNIKAGITGEGTSDNSVRIWAGASKANKETAPFRVQQNGKLIASNAEITGKVTATDGSFTGNVNATSGKIGGFDIGSGVIGVDNDGLDGLALHNSFIKFSQSGIWAGFGTNVLPASSGVVALGRFENNTPNPYSDNYGVIIKVSGGNNNHALSLRGDIQGFAVAAKQISSNYTATADDCILSCKNSAAMTLTLPTPSASQIGKVYIIKQFNVQAVVISCTNGIYAEHQVSEFSLYNNTKRGGACILVNDGQYWMVVADYWG